MNILVIQSHILAPASYLADCATAYGAEMTCRLPVENGDRVPEDASGFDGLILLGGPMFAEDDANHPHLGQCVELIRRFQAESKPILGICLGAQLIARAAGKKNYRMEKPEFGVSRLHRTAAGEDDPLLRDVRNPAHLMQWHEDSFELPDDAVLLMTNELCTNQVFRLGETTYGFQPHIEAKPEHIHQWLGHSPDAARKANPEFFVNHLDVIAAHARDMKTFSEISGRAWFELVRARR
jgi:GMP synthase-like glutamine amidotransferase